MCVAGWAHFCNSRARLASNDLKGLSPLIAPATGLDSETLSRFLKGTFKARTSKSKFFSQFFVFRPCTAKMPCAFKYLQGGRPIPSRALGRWKGCGLSRTVTPNYDAGI